MKGITRPVWITVGLIVGTALATVAGLSVDSGATAAGGSPTAAVLAGAAVTEAGTSTPPTLSVTAVLDKPGGTALYPLDTVEGTQYGNVEKVTIEGTCSANGSIIGVFERGGTRPIDKDDDEDKTFQFTVPVAAPRLYDFEVDVLTRDTSSSADPQPLIRDPNVDPVPVRIEISRVRPQVLRVDTSNLRNDTTTGLISVVFTTDRLRSETADAKRKVATFDVKGVVDAVVEAGDVTPISYDEGSNTARLQIAKMTPGVYELSVSDVTDWYGNKLLGNDETQEKYVERIFKAVGEEGTPTVRPGIAGPTGPYVQYPEWVQFREYPPGFNPADHVETRVARLYYYRDAHRVAQIVNRNSRSYNRAGVDMARQLADKARTVADQVTDARQHAEREAVRAAQRTRQAEAKLESTQKLLQQTFQDIQRLQGQQQLLQQQQQMQQAAEAAAAAEGTAPAVPTVPPEAAALASGSAALPGAPASVPATTEAAGEEQTSGTEKEDQLAKDIKARQDVANAVAAQVRALEGEVQRLREREQEQDEQAQQLDAREKRAREDQFRREVAAAHADPDTYAPGKPRSDDPVEQVSVSVIGEGLIQLRGPMKGINVIRRMINQIDAPVGQTRISVHSFQVNGEHGDRMEKVADMMQKYIDQSRFLTMRSAEMLRGAIVEVAGRRAMEAADQYPGDTQRDRDRRYLYAFFGRDFIDELAAMDSEFLHTGNKLLSLHSMDTTSLASALFLLALADNSTRLEIITRFEAMARGELPAAEQSYLESGTFCPEPCDILGRPKYCLLAGNAHFESLRGFFNQEMNGQADTMTPVQREFIRLAQIFKARLVTEMELEQRIRERALIEFSLRKVCFRLGQSRGMSAICGRAKLCAALILMGQLSSCPKGAGVRSRRRVSQGAPSACRFSDVVGVRLGPVGPARPGCGRTRPARALPGIA